MSALRSAELRAKLGDIDAELRGLAVTKDLDGGQEEHFARLKRQRDRVNDELSTLEERNARTEDLRRRLEAGDPTLRTYPGTDPTFVVQPDAVNARLSERQYDALRALERGASAGYFHGDGAERQEALIRKDPKHAAYIEIHSRSEY